MALPPGFSAKARSVYRDSQISGCTMGSTMRVSPCLIIGTTCTVPLPVTVNVHHSAGFVASNADSMSRIFTFTLR